MTTQQIASMIDSIGLPNAYYSYPVGEAPDVPYILFYYPNSQDFFADNQNYQAKSQLNIEVYTAEKDFEIERKVEKALREKGLTWQKEEAYITEENMFECLYVTEVFITNG
ncbi:hypothetical protein HMP0721_1261 [Pseudoramibacter alactolyticus ATCC 23263]|uniref:Uncharacterized protein n=1 Tax=Pseudoramibacter alactolyticus ATCC 23263 TaxID=887929 RepID=E6MGX7_9FIRM|nr:hypothetical protein [Pseudoramibacter alactolyticus]EFV01867.1 hypothetical protein HMP0721_1261 [Pseudoramibacter alactolyticus ATCC 23263]